LLIKQMRMKCIQWLVIVAILLTRATAQPHWNLPASVTPGVTEQLRSAADVRRFTHSLAPEIRCELNTTVQSSRGRILLKNIVLGSLSGLLIGTAVGLKGSEPAFSDIPFFAVLGSSIGFVTGLTIGAVKAARRMDDILF
jgi:hypothetical protein